MATSNNGIQQIKLDPARFVGVPKGATIQFIDVWNEGRVAYIPEIRFRFSLGFLEQREAMRVLVDELDAFLARRLKSPLRDGRHDRGWPKA